MSNCYLTQNCQNLTLFDIGFLGAMMPPLHDSFVVIAPMIMKFGTIIKLDVLYTMVTNKFVTSLLLCNYDVITCILADK